ncbi:hypothetical protein IFM89_015279 [Coptis chinensis]|uniref:TPX2 C-terminal domain-containing protein n=1 Tax=Coptis chinensis TaxID=261450 RepID=A0A835HHR2_9MAGN|nr:hypothetical protein IFM89_015279 [Coptis chinensis]
MPSLTFTASNGTRLVGTETAAGGVNKTTSQQSPNRRYVVFVCFVCIDIYMGREVIDISMDKEPDPAVVYSNGDGPHNPGNEHLDPEENNGLKDYEVKECTMECPVEILDHPQVENSQEEQDVLCDKSTNYESAFHEDQSPKPEVKKQGNNEKLDKSPTLGNVRTNCTVPQPFSLATERRASNGTRPVGTETAAGGVNKTTNLQSPNSRKKSQCKLASLFCSFVWSEFPLESRKPLQPDNKKHPDEDDTRSIASSTTFVRTSKSRTTIATAPKFRCTERADKRKEFYSKLEEKHRALEAERNQCETRTKEEREAALKQLRKSETFRANPMPSFYQEGPPPKVKLKKVLLDLYNFQLQSFLSQQRLKQHTVA